MNSSFSILNENLDDISITTETNNPIEMFIPRDPNLFLSAMILQNVTSIDDGQLFDFHLINFSEYLMIKDVSQSLHFETRPIDISLGYLFIYKFDGTPQLHSSINKIDGWKLFCPSNLSNDNIYKDFLDNRVVSNHQSIIFGLRILNPKQIEDFCLNILVNDPPIIDSPFNFTSDYYLRVYTSACYYLDKNTYWKSDGLWVGPLTNHNETHCFSNHLTTFSGSAMFLSPKKIYQIINQFNKNISLSSIFNVVNNKSQFDSFGLINSDIFDKCDEDIFTSK